MPNPDIDDPLAPKQDNSWANSIPRKRQMWDRPELTEQQSPRCTLCGEPMPEGEEMFKFHGYSGPCPKPPLPAPKVEHYVIAIHEGDPPLQVGSTFVVTEIEHSDNRKMLVRVRHTN